MHIRNFIIPAVLLAAALSMPNVRAASPGLYAGEAPVQDQSGPEQRRAMPVALGQVVQKLTGLSEFSEFPEVEPSLQNARSMAVTFYYRNRQITLPDGEQDEALYLVVEFSKPAVDSLIQSLELPIWEPERRPLTVWLLVDDGASRRIMPIELEYAWEAIAEVARGRGLPIIRPEPDEDGNYAIDAQLLWGGYTDELTTEGPVDSLVIAARREGPEWNVRMNLEYTNELLSWRNRHVDIVVALQEGMNHAIDEIAAFNSIAASDQGQENYEITVIGISSAARYARCLDYLNNLSLVDHVKVESATAGMVRFQLTLNAVPDYFLRSLETDGVLSATGTLDEYALQP